MIDSNLVDDPKWRLDRFEDNGKSAIFISADRHRVSEAPFLDNRWRKASDITKTAPVQTVLTATPRCQTPAFIWHSAFCCSTLLAGLLDCPQKVLSVREPDPLMTLANAKRHGQYSTHALSSVLDWVARGYALNERAVVKPTNLANNLMSDVMRVRPDSRAILLTSSLKAFLLSIAKKREAGRAFARFMYSVLAMDGHAKPIHETDRLRLTDMQIAALVWHMQIAAMNAMAQTVGGKRVAWLDGDAFIANPQPVLLHVSEFLELELTSEDIAAAINGPKLQRNAKAPNQAFAAEDRLSQSATAERDMGEELDRIIEWSFQIHPETPRGDPVSPALMAL